MNASTAFVLVGVIILLYVLFTYLTRSKSTLVKMQDMNTPILPVAVTSPTSRIYSYSFWIFVKTWSNNSVKNIFTHGSDFSLDLGATSPTLSYKLSTNTKVDITDNFPIQTWMFVTVVVNNQVVDAYLNGKLILSKQLPIAVVQPSATTISFGQFDADLVNFQRDDAALDTTTVWNKYLEGNGKTGGLSMSKYGVTVGLTKNGQPKSSFQLF